VVPLKSNKVQWVLDLVNCFVTMTFGHGGWDCSLRSGGGAHALPLAPSLPLLQALIGRDRPQGFETARFACWYYFMGNSIEGSFPRG
jgi:hypothetical protein